MSSFPRPMLPTNMPTPLAARRSRRTSHDAADDEHLEAFEAGSSSSYQQATIQRQGSATRLSTHRVRSARVWDVKLPRGGNKSSKASAASRYVPSLKNLGLLRKQTFRISIEIHKPRMQRSGSGGSVTARPSTDSWDPNNGTDGEEGYDTAPEEESGVGVGAANGGEDERLLPASVRRSNAASPLRVAEKLPPPPPPMYALVQSPLTDDEDDAAALVAHRDAEEGVEAKVDTTPFMMDLLSGSPLGARGSILHEQLAEDEKVVVRILRPAKRRERTIASSYMGDEYDDDDFADAYEEQPYKPSSYQRDDSSVSTLGFYGPDETKEPDLWIEKLNLPLNSVSLGKYSKNMCEVRMRSGYDFEVQQYVFDTDSEARNFVKVVQMLKKLESDRKSKIYTGENRASPTALLGARPNTVEEESTEARDTVPDHATVTGDRSDSMTLLPQGRGPSTVATAPPTFSLDNDDGGDDNDDYDERVDQRSFLPSSAASFFTRSPSADENDDATGGGSATFATVTTDRSFVSFAPLIKTRGGVVYEQDMIRIMVEIVSASDLQRNDVISKSSDPYLVVSMANRVIHRTKHISNTTDPIWTIRTGSHLLISSTKEDFFAPEHGVRFEVKDYDGGITADDFLGQVTIPQQVLVDGTGERVEYELQDAVEDDEDDLEMNFSRQDEAKVERGTLALRYRLATDEEVKFMDRLGPTSTKRSPQSSDLGIYSSSSFIAPGVVKSSRGFGLGRRTVRTGENGVKEFRVKPGPDPMRPDTTEWMTEDQMNSEAIKASTQWIEAGSGTIGKLYVEIIGCDGLSDRKTDPFACLVFEDTVVNSDVIFDTLAPRWMPWTQRAFLFNIQHPSSSLFVGVLDYDSGRLDDHDALGRVTVDITNLRPDTEYTLHYNLYPSAHLAEDRIPTGTLTLRLRLEWSNGRDVFKVALESPPVSHVNMEKRKDFRAARYACDGKYDMDRFGLKTLKLHVDDLLSYTVVLTYITEAIMTVIFWRGHFTVYFLSPANVSREASCGQNCCQILCRRWAWKPTKLPLHSALAFLIGIAVVENPNFLPSALVFMISWILFATLEQRQKHPSPWKRCRPWNDLLKTLLCSSSRPLLITPYANDAAIKEYEAVEVEKEKEQEVELERKKETAKQRAKEAMERREEIGETDVDIETKEGLELSPLKPLLYPVQTILGDVCIQLRLVKSVVIWDDCYTAFVVALCFLVLSLLILFIPWGWVILWTSRIVVWTILGPWMWIVDRCFIQRRAKPTAEDSPKDEDEEEEDVEDEAHEKRVLEAQVKRERAAKLKAMTQYMFGQYITRVPRGKSDKFKDVPLVASSAQPIRKRKKRKTDHDDDFPKIRVGGQRLLDDDIIPSREFSEMGELTEARSDAKSEVQTLGSDEDYQTEAADELSPLNRLTGSPRSLFSAPKTSYGAAAVEPLT